jgi:demethylmenaquinone methyltransferase / 2-methoxy-6-polyprenyl-1,4-benzoquinol methylase
MSNLDRMTADGRLRGDDVSRAVFADLPARYDQLAYLLSFGQDRRWRRAVVDRVAAARPSRVLDVATGPAGIALAVAERTGAQVVGVDLNEPMLRAGAANVRAVGRQRQLGLAVARADQLPFDDGAFDAVVFSYLLRYVDDPAATVAELARCLRPGGTLASLDFYVPPHPVWHASWQFYTRAALPVLGGLTGGPAWREVGEFLGPSISTHYKLHPLAEHVAAWQAAGLEDVEVRLMSLGGGLVMAGRKRAPAAGAAPDAGGAQAAGKAAAMTEKVQEGRAGQEGQGGRAGQEVQEGEGGRAGQGGREAQAAPGARG